MSGYTPTIKEIREYVEDGGEPRPWVAPSDSERDVAHARAAAFDRGIAAYEEQITSPLRSQIDALVTEVAYLRGCTEQDVRTALDGLSVPQSADSEAPDDAAGARPDIAVDEDPFFDNDPDSRMGF